MLTHTFTAHTEGKVDQTNLAIYTSCCYVVEACILYAQHVLFIRMSTTNVMLDFCHKMCQNSQISCPYLESGRKMHQNSTNKHTLGIVVLEITYGISLSAAKVFISCSAFHQRIISIITGMSSALHRFKRCDCEYKLCLLVGKGLLLSPVTILPLNMLICRLVGEGLLLSPVTILPLNMLIGR